MNMIYLGCLHFVADWLLQSRRVGDNKSKSWLILGEHVFTVTVIMFTGALAWVAWNGTLDFGALVLWTLINGVAHFATDAVTSRLTSKFYKEQRWKVFWTTIGADQWLLHWPVLVLTTEYLLV